MGWMNNTLGGAGTLGGVGAAVGAGVAPWAALGGGLLGLGSYFFGDKPDAERKNKLLAAQYEASGYNKALTPQDGRLATANPFQEVLQFGSTGAQIGAGIDRDKFQNDKDASLAKYYDNGGPWSLMNRYAAPEDWQGLGDSTLQSPTETRNPWFSLYGRTK